MSLVITEEQSCSKKMNWMEVWVKNGSDGFILKCWYDSGMLLLEWNLSLCVIRCNCWYCGCNISLQLFCRKVHFYKFTKTVFWLKQTIVHTSHWMNVEEHFVLRYKLSCVVVLNWMVGTRKWVAGPFLVGWGAFTKKGLDQLFWF